MTQPRTNRQWDFLSTQSLLFCAAFPATLAWTTSAAAEVLDKLEFPWDFSHYGHMLVVLLCGSALAASKHFSIRVAGLVVTIIWATTSLWMDPWFTPDIGNALRAELTAEQSAKWLRTILIQALLPVGVVLGVFLWRTITSALAQSSPR